MQWTVNDVIKNLPRRKVYKSLTRPRWDPSGGKEKGVALAVESMSCHMTDEGWQLMLGLQHARYELFGYGLLGNYTDVKKILDLAPPCTSITCVVQDKREWDVQPGDFREPKAKFTNVQMLASRPDIFKVTVVKDAQHNPHYHAEAAQEMGCHGWIIYYHPKIVKHLAWYVRPEHCVRTYHTLNPRDVPRWNPMADRAGCILSGAVSSAYPLRQRLARNQGQLPNLYVKAHPGYHRNQCDTPAFLRELTNYKVAICTASIYGYSLRKIIEATAAGCIVVTDLPEDDTMPVIDGNLVRVHPDITVPQMKEVLNKVREEYNPHKQEYYARACIENYNYEFQGNLLAYKIRELKDKWSSV